MCPKLTMKTLLPVSLFLILSISNSIAENVVPHYLDDTKSLDDTYYPNNQIRILPDGVEDYKIRTELIKNAKKYIHIYTLLFENNETGKNSAIQLSTKSFLENIEVNVIYDTKLQLFSSSNSIITAMRNMNVNTRNYMPKNTGLNFIKYFLFGSHKKLMIVDSEKYGQEAIVGGRNIGDNYFSNVSNPIEGEFNNLWRDNDYYLRGPIVAGLMKSYMFSFNEQTKQKEFKLECREKSESLETCKYFPKLQNGNEEKGFHSNVEIGLIENEPLWNNGQGIYQINELYERLIDNAQTSIDITTPYFVPSRKLLNKLLAALDRGVRIRLITNSKETNDMSKAIYYAASYFWQKIVEKGAEVYIWIPENSPKEKGKNGRCFHAKGIIVDSFVFVPGSWNFDNRSLFQENEFAFPIYNSKMAKTALEMYERDLNITGMTLISEKWFDDNFSFWDKVYRKVTLILLEHVL